MEQIAMSSRFVLLIIGISLIATFTGCTAIAENDGPLFDNPIVEQRADPWVYLHTDGFYYMTATVPEYDRIEVRRSRTIEDLGDAQPHVIWYKKDDGPMGAHIWAPELHHINGKWYIHFAAGGAKDIWRIRMYVLECSDPNPLTGDWIEKGQIKTNWDSFSLDATTFVHNSKRYLIWAQTLPGPGHVSCLYIAEMENPWTIKGKQVLLTKPELPWEIRGQKVNEGAAVIHRNGRLFVTFSASATDSNYCIGMLTAKEDADLLDPKSWIKSTLPVFSSYEPSSIFGPGHNSFTTTPDGKTDLLVYHARDYRDIKGPPLSDPNRATRVQILNWNDDGTPDFGYPLPHRLSE